MKRITTALAAVIVFSCILFFCNCGKKTSAPALYTVSTNSIKMIFNGIPAGSFIMGDNQGISNEQPAHKVNITNFLISIYDTTYANWVQVYQWAIANGYSFTNDGAMGYNAKGDKNKNPVVFVSWYDAVKWCNALSEMEKKTPVYYTDAKFKNVYKSGDIDIGIKNVNWDANGYRIPTEAEWEYAARASSTNKYFWGNDASAAPGYVWYKEGSQNSTHETGTKNPNDWGLYDMTGNVWEWCFDAYDTYTDAEKSNPLGAASGTTRVIRGGGFSSSADEFRPSVRVPEDPSYNNKDVGFRIVTRSK